MGGNVAKAARRGQWDKVKDLVDRGGDVNVRDGMGWTALHHAADYTNVEMCKFLLGRGADVAARDKNGYMAISTAIWSNGPNSLDVVRLLLTDVSVNAVNNDGRRPLHYAALLSLVDIVQLLVDHGAHTNVVDRYGYTPLHVANRWRCDVPKVTTMLLRKEAKVDAVNKDGDQPLHLACTFGNIKSARLLLSSGANSCASNNDGKTPLHCAAGEWTECVELCDILLTHDADVHAADKDGNQPLHLACMKGNIKSARLLLSSGASSCASNNDGKTPLHCAASARTDFSELCDILLTHDADIHAADKDGNQPLHIACKKSKIENGKVLISHGADVVAINGQNLSPFQLASQHCGNHPDLCLALSRAGLTSIQTEHICQALEFAFSKNNQLTGWVLSKISAMAEISVSENLSKWIDTMDVDELLATAIVKEQMDTSMVLIENGVSVNGPDRLDIRPLTLAVKEGQFNMCKLLIKQGASVNANGYTCKEPPIYYALTGNKTEIVKLLLSHGAEIMNVKVGKRSALERSQTTGSRTVARILNSAGIYHVFVITTCILINII